VNALPRSERRDGPESEGAGEKPPGSGLDVRLVTVHVRAAHVRDGLAVGRTVLRRRPETEVRQLGRGVRVRARRPRMRTALRGKPRCYGGVVTEPSNFERARPLYLKNGSP